MPQIINTNIASLNAQRNLNASQRAQDVALQRLSSGLRINSSSDDAAGLAISTRFDAQIRGTNQAIRNAGDAISLSQTAEGALNSMTTNLQRIRELALQSANDTNTTLDRNAIQAEVDQLLAEIQNISKITNFNGRNLLDGSFQNAVFQTGANAGETISVSIAKLSTDSLGSATTSGISSRTQITGLVGTSTNALVAGDMVLNGFAVTGSVATDDNSSTAQGSSSAIAKAAAINKSTSDTGITATVDANFVAGASAGGVTTTNATVAINGVAITLGNDTLLSAEQNLTAVAGAINARSAQTGVRAVFTGDVVTGINLIADDGRNIAVGGTAAAITAKFGLVSNTAVSSTATAAVTLTSTNDVFIGTFTLNSKDGSNIKVTSNTGDIDNAGFEVGTFSGVNSGAVSDATNSSAQDVLQTGDLVINGISVAGSLASDDNASSDRGLANTSGIAKAAAINRVSSQSGVTATVNENRLYSGDVLTTTSNGVATINGVALSTGAFASNDSVDVKLKGIVAAFNNISGQTGVKAEALDADSFVLIAADGRNITLTGGTTFVTVADVGDNTTFVAAVSLQGGGTITLSSNTGAIKNSGFRIGDFGGADSGTLLNNISVTTAAKASDAVIAADNALKTISARVADFGAIQNRFTNTIANLEVNVENLSAANSRIKDADFAAETAALSRSQVLQQAGIAILAQANARPQQVLSLLQ